MIKRDIILGMICFILGATLAGGFIGYEAYRLLKWSQYSQIYTEEINFRNHYFIMKNVSDKCFGEMPERTLRNLYCNTQYYEDTIRNIEGYTKVNMTEDEYKDYKSFLPEAKCF